MKFYNESSSLIFKDLVLGNDEVGSSNLLVSSKNHSVRGGFFTGDAQTLFSLFRHFVPYDPRH